MFIFARCISTQCTYNGLEFLLGNFDYRIIFRWIRTKNHHKQYSEFVIWSNWLMSRRLWTYKGLYQFRSVQIHHVCSFVFELRSNGSSSGTGVYGPWDGLIDSSRLEVQVSISGVVLRQIPFSKHNFQQNASNWHAIFEAISEQSWTTFGSC